MDFGCVGTPCALPIAQITTARRINCTTLPPIDFANWNCTGQWAVERGTPPLTICTIQAVPTTTSAARFSVSCGTCVTIVEMN
jgi:hypothetical protein